MMKTKIFMMLVMAVAAVTATAKSWRVNPNEMSGAQYTSIAQVMDQPGFNEGDTIICDPGLYGKVTINKKNAVLLGPGIFKGQNDVQSSGTSALFTEIVCEAPGVKLVGLESSGAIFTSDKCHVIRCRADNVQANGSTGDTGIYSTECVISQGYFERVCNFKNTVISNNIITARFDNLYRLENVEILHNTLVATASGYVISLTKSCTIRDNIIVNPYYGNYGVRYVLNPSEMQKDGNNLSYNLIGIPEEIPAYPIGNIYCDSVLSEIFTQEGGMESKYSLLDTSLAKGAASDGTDCGAFGGPNPYVLGGSPIYMPQITNAAVSPDQSNGKVRVKLTIATQHQ